MKSITVLSALEKYIKKVQDYSDNDFKTNYPNTWALGQAPKFTYERSPKWYKVYRKDSQQCIFAFIDPETGDIYKPASYKVPAKGVRGNIFDEKPPVTSGSLYR